MPSWGDLVGKGSPAEQLLVWGILNQLLGDLFGPLLETIRQNVNALDPVAVLAPADLADAVVRGIRTQESAQAEAQRSGIDGARFTDLVQGAGEPPGLETVLEMWRRGYIPWADAGPESASVERAIRTSRVYNYWSEAIQRNADVPISVGEAVDALLRGQIGRDEALAEAKANGINQERFDVLLNAAGRPPSPGELVELLRRKLIPLTGTGPGVVSFQQGIFEGDAKDKWWEQYANLKDYIPPPRTVVALLKTGAVTEAEAAALFQDAGLSPELAAKYVTSAKGEKMAGTRQLAEQTILTLYDVHALDGPTATAHLTALGYDHADVTLMLELADLRRELAQVNATVTRIRALYIGHKITRQAAADTLHALDLNPTSSAHLLSTWDLEAAANVHQLTPAQIVDAWEYSIIDQAEAEAELVHLGYTPRDAWILLSNKAKGPLPNPPAQGPAGPGVIP